LLTTRGKIVVVGLLLAFVAVGVLAFTNNSTPPLAPDAARIIAEAFLSQLRDGKVDAAWSDTTAEFKSLQGRDTFRTYVSSKPTLKKPVEFVKADATDANGLKLTVCEFKSSATRVLVSLAFDGIAWKVERLQVE
jgi:hypothetical protein